MTGVSRSDIEKVLGRKAELIVGEETAHIGIVVKSPDPNAPYAIAYTTAAASRSFPAYKNIHPEDVKCMISDKSEVLIEVERLNGGGIYNRQDRKALREVTALLHAHRV
jgi:hypothetical protein